MRLAGRVAVVTGAGSGLGAATARRFAEEGARVVATDLHLDAAQQTVSGLIGGPHLAVEHDVRAESSWADVYASTAQLGVASILVNNAGIFCLGPVTEITEGDLNAVMAVNVTGVALGMKHGALHMRGGAIVNLSSVAGIVGSPLHTIYGASKGAVRAMTKSAAVELAAAGIRVNSVHPAIVDTPMSEVGLAQLGIPRNKLERAYPLGRFGRPEEVANAVLFLASEEASFITGVELVVDGGLTAH